MTQSIGPDVNSTSTSQDAIAVTPSDAIIFPNLSPGYTPRGLLISVGGTLKVDTAGGGSNNPRTLTVPAGPFNCAVTRVWAATTCTGITAMI